KLPETVDGDTVTWSLISATGDFITANGDVKVVGNVLTIDASKVNTTGSMSFSTTLNSAQSGTYIQTSILTTHTVSVEVNVTPSSDNLKWASNVPLVFAGGEAGTVTVAAITSGAVPALSAPVTFTASGTAIIQSTPGVTYTWRVSAIQAADYGCKASDIVITPNDGSTGVPSVKIPSSAGTWAAGDGFTLELTVSFDNVPADVHFTRNIWLW
ncbi:MAG: hypothetical protein LBH03_05555, partial [Holophagales bacterium]|nr:hypothetical protein [Holophagales bacterium]